MDTFLEKIKTDISNICKIKMIYKVRNVTWRIGKDYMYMYDCGTNYASVTSLKTLEELLCSLSKVLTETSDVIIKYTNGHKDSIPVYIS